MVDEIDLKLVGIKTFGMKCVSYINNNSLIPYRCYEFPHIRRGRMKIFKVLFIKNFMIAYVCFHFSKSSFTSEFSLKYSFIIIRDNNEYVVTQ